MEKETKNFYGLVETLVNKDTVNEEEGTYNDFLVPHSCALTLCEDKESLIDEHFASRLKIFEIWGKPLPLVCSSKKVLAIAKFSEQNWSDKKKTLDFVKIEDIYYKDKWLKKI